MDESRYARYGGFRREENLPYNTQFGYGGSGYGGFGRLGQHGGWRSHYDYNVPMKYVYDGPDNYPINMIYPTSHMPTFILAVSVVVVLSLGLWYGKSSGYYY
jgi:hypothetical protein